MAVIINQPPSEERGISLGLILGIAIGALFVLLFLIYILPSLKNQNESSAPGGVDVKVTLPPPSPTPPSTSPPPPGGSQY